VPVRVRIIHAHTTVRLQHLLRQHSDAIANSIVLEQGKTYADAQGDLLRGLQVVETATGIPTALLGNHIEVTKDMDTSTRRLPLGVCARYMFCLVQLCQR
jgi:malonate-semialdehyde dehydrogenase (acetylating) / methylmalonate-semialdehyde dehydrogenase